MNLPERRLVLVHAHPDDECLGTGGVMSKYSSEGAHVCLITCTNGELGEIAEVPGLGPPDTLRERLGEIRLEELREACRILGTSDLRPLGYRDSGMAGTPTNDDPEAFVNRDRAQVVAELVAILREVRPQVLVTYNAYGFYGHPDHIRAHEVAMAAVEAAADQAYQPDLGPVHQVAKVYHTAVPKSRLRRAREVFPDAEARFTEEEIERIGTDDDVVTTSVEVGEYVDRKFRALEAHRTQLGTTGDFLSIPPEFRRLAMGTEHFVLAVSTVGQADGDEADLFERVPMDG